MALNIERVFWNKISVFIYFSLSPSPSSISHLFWYTHLSRLQVFMFLLCKVYLRCRQNFHEMSNIISMRYWENIIPFEPKNCSTMIRHSSSIFFEFAYVELIINPRGHAISLLLSQRLATPRSVIMWRCVDFMSIAYFAMYVVHFMLLGILRIPYLHFSSYSKWKWATA